MKIFVSLFCGLIFLNGIELKKFTNVVIDTTNHIVWQDNDEVGDYKETSTMADVYCQTLILNGHTNWRVPTIKELQTIVDIQQQNTINKLFSHTTPDIYRTSTKFKKDSTYKWGIDFKTGEIKYINNIDKFCIRCVREDI